MWLTAIGAVFVGLGVAIAWYGLRPLVVVPRLLRADPTPPGAVTASDGFVVTRGTATATDGTLLAPFTESACLGFEFTVTERQPFGPGLPWSFVDIDDGAATVRFSLVSDGGELSVDPSRRRFGLDTDSTRLTVGANEVPPERIRQFVDIRETLQPVAGWLTVIPGLGIRRYTERRIDPGASYLVAGRVGSADGEPTLSGDLVITDRLPRRLAFSRLQAAVFPLVVAGLFIAVGAWGVVG